MQPKLTAHFVEGANPSSTHSVIRVVASDPGQGVDRDRLETLLRGILETPCIFALPAPEGLSDLASHAAVDNLGAVAATAVMLQRQIGYDVSRCERRTGSGFREHWWFECIDRDSGLLALRLAGDLVGLLSNEVDQPELAAAIATRLDELLEPVDFSTWLMWRAAQRMGIPCRYMLRGALYYELGLGARAYRIHKGMFEPETHISFRLGANKRWTSQLLHDAGLRVPLQRVVTSLEGAREAAAAIGYPVVVKPPDRGGQKGVVVNIRSEAELREACSGLPPGAAWLVEQHVPGRHYRLIAVNGSLLNAYEYQRPFVVGNGRDSIRALIEEENRSPLRGRSKRFAHPPIDIKAVAKNRRTPFADSGLTLDSVPGKGARVDLSYFGGYYHAGMVTEVTDRVHPDYAKILRRAHAKIPIPVCGYDFICADISAPPMERGYALNEVNSFPALRNYRLEGPEAPSPVKLLQAITGGPAALRVPLVVVVTEAGVPSLATAVAAALASDDRSVALASRTGYFLGPDRWGEGSHADLSGLQRAVCDREAEAIVVERYAGELARSGLGLAEVDLVVLAPDPEGNLPRFLERTAFLRGVGRKGSIYVGVPPARVPAPGRGEAPNIVVWSADLPEMSPSVAEVVFHKPGTDAATARSAAGAARELPWPVRHSDDSPLDRLTAAAVLDRIEAESGG